MRWTKVINATTDGLEKVPVVVQYDTEVRRMALLGPYFARLYSGVRPELFRKVNDGAAYEPSVQQIHGYHLLETVNRGAVLAWLAEYSSCFDKKDWERWNALSPTYQAAKAEADAAYQAKVEAEAAAKAKLFSESAAAPRPETKPIKRRSRAEVAAELRAKAKE